MATTKRYLFLFAIAYFLSSQATVVCTVSEWYSTFGAAAVAWQSGPMREHASLSWTPRTHLPMNKQTTLPAEEPPTLAFYPSWNGSDGRKACECCRDNTSAGGCG
jgi:hypothetical protein